MAKREVTPKPAQGFTLVELLVVIGITAIMMAVALPSLLQWRESLRYKEAGKGVVAALRSARSTAITTNRQVELLLAADSYRTRSGNRAIASTVWSDSSRVALPTGVGLSSPDSRVIANPNGTLFFTSAAEAAALFSSESATMAVSVQDTSAAPPVNRYGITLSQTGRISGAQIQ